jgi:UDP-N-acetylglucosamine--N-acetylmuramyl-(pentapeptide) pyrophosphoryl-undecaprenol N-acetylglucosamine transferase
MSAAKIALAAGGTGGHVFPADALAAELATRGCELLLITDRRGGAYGGRLANLETHRIRAGGIAGKSVLARLVSIAEIFVGIAQAYRLLKRLRPAVVVGFGGYASVPTMLAARFAGIRTVIHEQNAVLGRANRLLASKVARLATSFEKVSHLPEPAPSLVFTGMPVRPAVAELRERPYPARVAGEEVRILVFGGSQGATVFARIVPEAVAKVAPKLASPLLVTQQCRKDDVEAVKATYAAHGIPADVAAFYDDLPKRISDSHLVISRAGASTVAELTALGRPAIIVPYPHAIDDHQTSNAHALDEAGAGWLMPEDFFTVDSLAARLESLLTMPRILETAAAASKAAAKPDAASRLADVVLGLVNGNGGNGHAETRKEAA